MFRKFVLLSTMLLTFGLFSSENLVKNPGFEEDLKGSWRGGPFGGGPGKLERSGEAPFAGKFCIHLHKEKGPGGTQLISSPIPLDAERIAISFYHRGKNGDFRVGFYQKEGKKYEALIGPLGKQVTKLVKLPRAAEWRKFELELDIPDSYRANETAILLSVQMWGAQEPGDLFLDEVSVVAIPAKPEETLDPKVVFDIAKPHKLSEQELAQYGKIKSEFSYEIKDGLLYRNGRPYFWAGDGCTLGSAQATPAGLWLARLQGIRFVSLEGGKSINAKAEGDKINIYSSLGPHYGLHSWQREAVRFNMLPQVAVGMGGYRRSMLQKLAEQTPELREFYYAAGHGITADHHHPYGRKMLELSRSASVKYTALLDNVVCEINREPGPNPSNNRIRRDFREYAKQKYGTLEAANQVWRRNYKSWAQVQPPHLESDGILDTSMQIKLRAKVARDSHEMYYDWLRFAQLDYAAGVRKERDDLKKLIPQAAITIDVRGHRGYTDAYAILDPDLIDELVDLFFVHYEFSAFIHNGQPTDLTTLHRQLSYPLFNYNFFKTNSKHPIWDSENIVARTRMPGSNAEAMNKNDIGQLHGDWQFRLDEKKEGFTREWFKPQFNDSAWGTMAVPGIWDQTEAYAGKSGWAWYRKRFTANANKQDFLDGSRKFLIYGHGIAQKGTIWLNGHQIGEVKGWNSFYQFDIGPYLNFNGENQITVFVDGTGFHNGLRNYIHILADDMINESRPFSEAQFTSMLWTMMMRGSSALSIWNWSEDQLRPYMGNLVDEINSVSEIVLPAVRRQNGKVAYLYSYLYGKGVPCPADKSHEDHMNYYNALEFSQLRPDVLGEKNFLAITPESHELAVIPYARIVYPETWEKVKNYVQAGGTAAVSFGSLQETFDRYAATDFPKLAGIKFTGDNQHEKITMNGRSFDIETGDETKSKGVKITLDGAKALHQYPDGSPAVTVNQYGKGKFIFIAPRLDLYGVREALKPYLPKPEVAIASGESREYPFIETMLAGNDERKLLYLHNWGGLDHPLTVTVPREYASFTARPIRGSFERTAGNVFRVKVPSSAPVALLLEKPGISPLPLARANPARDQLLNRLAELNRDGDGSRPKVLFIEREKRQYALCGRELYPNLTDIIDKLGFETHAVPLANWTPELLKDFKLVVLCETGSRAYRAVLSNDSPWSKHLVDYVKEGGSLLVMCHTANTVNSNAGLLRKLTPQFGVGVKNNVVFDPEHCGFGDPAQILTGNLATHPVTANIGKIQLYASSPLAIKKNSIVKTVVSTPAGDPMMAAGEFGKGRVFFSADLMWLQPQRIELYDNARLLVNVLAYLLRKDIPEAEKRNLLDNLLVTGKTYREIEKRN